MGHDPAETKLLKRRHFSFFLPPQTTTMSHSFVLSHTKVKKKQKTKKKFDENKLSLPKKNKQKIQKGASSCFLFKKKKIKMRNSETTAWPNALRETHTLCVFLCVRVYTYRIERCPLGLSIINLSAVVCRVDKYPNETKETHLFFSFLSSFFTCTCVSTEPPQKKTKKTLNLLCFLRRI